ncbi:MAG: trypsin-like peptidase domain-containing protein [Candidatus Melainabacteria bacterium]|nr:trypsin-like peptidase domain-containing protein [Candidatus Melainabacteria bacterium]
MLDYPEHIQAPIQDEAAQTPRWVADAGSRTWLEKDQTSMVRVVNVADCSGNADPTAELRYGSVFTREQGQINPTWRQDTFHTFFDSSEQAPAPSTSRFYTYRGGKPYGAQENQSVQPVVPIAIPFPDTRPLDEQVIPKGDPLPGAPGRNFEKQPQAPEAQPGAVIADDNKVLIPTFSLLDPVLDGKNKPKVETFDINSPEAKLYLQNRDSIVKITTDKVNSEGKTYNAFGSGFFVNENGQIATANHVIDGATSIKVTTASGKTYTARVKESHPGSESAVIELTDALAGERFRPIPLRDSAKDLAPGEKLTVLGHPNGVNEIVMSRGSFASRERFAGSSFSLPGVNPNAMFVHATTRIQGGNSGGPLLDSQGRAVGLTNFRHDDNSGEFVGIDDVRSLIVDSKQSKLFDQRSYVFPSSLQFDKDTGLKSIETLLPAISGANAYIGRNATRLVRLNSAARISTSAMVSGFAVSEMPGDYRAFKSAWSQGTTAETVNAGINLGGDVLMAAGSVAAVFSKRYAIVGTTIATLGAGSKLGNAILGDRRYH